MITYKVNLENYSEVAKVIQEINDSLQSEEFKHFLLEKCKQELDAIIRQKLVDVESDIMQIYPDGNSTKIGSDYIELFNNSMVDLSNLGEKALQNYTSGLSMAKLVEFGTGVVGAASEASSYAEDWEYDVNSHGNKGWYYQKDGMIYWSRGMEGKLIYHTLQLKIEEKISGWIEEYLQDKIGK